MHIRVQHTKPIVSASADSLHKLQTRYAQRDYIAICANRQLPGIHNLARNASPPRFAIVNANTSREFNHIGPLISPRIFREKKLHLSERMKFQKDPL